MLILQFLGWRSLVFTKKSNLHFWFHCAISRRVSFLWYLLFFPEFDSIASGDETECDQKKFCVNVVQYVEKCTFFAVFDLDHGRKSKKMGNYLFSSEWQISNPTFKENIYFSHICSWKNILLIIRKMNIFLFDFSHPAKGSREVRKYLSCLKLIN